MFYHDLLVKLVIPLSVFFVVFALTAFPAVAAAANPGSKDSLDPEQEEEIPFKEPSLDPNTSGSDAERANQKSSADTQKSFSDDLISKLEQQLQDANDRLNQMFQEAKMLVDPRKPDSVFHSFYQRFSSGVNNIVTMVESSNVFQNWEPVDAFLSDFPEVRDTKENQSVFPNLKRWALFNASISFVLTGIAPIFSELSTAIFTPKDIANTEQDQDVNIKTSLSISTATFFVIVTNNIGLIASWLNFAPYNNIMYLVQTSVMAAMLFAYRESLSFMYVLREYKRGNAKAFSESGYPRFYVFGISLAFSIFGLMRRIETFQFVPTRDATIDVSYDTPTFSIETRIAGKKCILIDQSSIFFHFVLFCAIMCSAAKLQLVIELALITFYGSISKFKDWIGNRSGREASVVNRLAIVFEASNFREFISELSKGEFSSNGDLQWLPLNTLFAYACLARKVPFGYLNSPNLYQGTTFPQTDLFPLITVNGTRFLKSSVTHAPNTVAFNELHEHVKVDITVNPNSELSQSSIDEAIKRSLVGPIRVKPLSLNQWIARGNTPFAPTDILKAGCASHYPLSKLPAWAVHVLESNRILTKTYPFLKGCIISPIYIQYVIDNQSYLIWILRDITNGSTKFLLLSDGTDYANCFVRETETIRHDNVYDFFNLVRKEDDCQFLLTSSDYINTYLSTLKGFNDKVVYIRILFDSSGIDEKFSTSRAKTAQDSAPSATE
jgi:hypothetical protein